MCLEKSIFNRLFLRGRDEVERAFEKCRVSSGERHTAVYMHGLYLNITMDIIIMGEHFSLAVLCVSLVHVFC